VRFNILFWDLDETILNFEAAERAALQKGFREFHLGPCTDEMMRRYHVINIKYWERLERGEITKPEVLRGRYVEWFGVEGIECEDIDAFVAAFQINLGDTIVFYDNAKELLIRLKERGVKQYLVTNGTEVAQTNKLKKSGLDEIVDGVFISELLGAEKPSKAYFDEVLKAVQAECGKVEPKDILMIGDSLTSDMPGGERAGLTTCWYNPKHKVNDKGVRIDYEISNLNEIETIIETIEA